MAAKPADAVSITLTERQVRPDDDPRLSRSLLRGLSLLARFGPGTPVRGVVELAHELDMSPSTAHRYVLTLVEAGVLERVPRTRKYRLAGR
jgi:DNA-binding IclR family transcriptional regulator